jgi:ubiquinol-cytochrome c reductase cytochrome b subunit
VTAPPDAARRPAGVFWPEQVFMDTVASALVFLVVLVLVLAEGGANLDAPADPSSGGYPARPEWYFLSLFQMLKLFPGNREMIGTIVIPTALLLVMLSLPFWDWVLPGKAAHFLACGFVFAVVAGAGYLTVQAILADAEDSLFQAARQKADAARHRALYLAGLPEAGIPPEGSAYILRRDPFTHGQAVWERRCNGCHVHGGRGTGAQSAADLAGFGTRAWIRGLLENPQAPPYFGRVPQCNGMSEWKRTSKLSPAQLDQVADFVASFAQIAPDLTPDEWLASPGVSDHPGLKFFEKGGECGKCHILAELSEGGLREAPDLFGWGSPRWMARMIRKPAAADRYGFLEADQKMPEFGADQLTQNDLEMVIRFLKADYPVNGSGAGPATPESAARSTAAGEARR